MPTPSYCDRLTPRVVLLKVSPLVARLISVPDDLSLEELHDVLYEAAFAARQDVVND